MSYDTETEDYGFPVDPTLSMTVFGTPDAWEGDPGP